LITLLIKRNGSDISKIWQHGGERRRVDDGTIEGILGHLEHLKATVPTSNKRLREAVMNSWAKLQEYYTLTDGSLSIYAAATLFHPPLRMKHFIHAWTGK
jgi:hypothetical protein